MYIRSRSIWSVNSARHPRLFALLSIRSADAIRIKHLAWQAELPHWLFVPPEIGVHRVLSRRPPIGYGSSLLFHGPISERGTRGTLSAPFGRNKRGHRETLIFCFLGTRIKYSSAQILELHQASPNDSFPQSRPPPPSSKSHPPSAFRTRPPLCPTPYPPLCKRGVCKARCYSARG